MSIHSSLRGVSTLTGERSVLTRLERLAVLKKEGKFSEEKSSVYGLPKVRTRFKVAGAKKKAKEPAAAKPGEGGAAAATPAPAAAATAAAAKPAEKAGDKKKADKK
jgi:small basic protein (TIGR04137 family)